MNLDSLFKTRPHAQDSEFSEGELSHHETSLNETFSMDVQGPIESAQEDDDWYSIALFRYDGKPYILARGWQTSARVISVWENNPKTWCQYQVLPQHKVDVYYPVESWPVLQVSNFKKTKGAQALHNAAEGGDLERAIALVKEGTPIDAVDEMGRTPLVGASFNGRFNVVKWLLDNGASVNGVSQETPLAHAVMKNRDDIVALLLERKANPNIRHDPPPIVVNRKSTTALDIARRLEQRYNADPVSEDALKNKRIIELLLKAGAVE